MSQNTLLSIFCAKACSPPVLRSAKAFENFSGKHIEVSVCSRHCANQENHNDGTHHTLISEIIEAGFHDIVVSGAEYQLDELEEMGIVIPNTRKLLGYRVSSIIVKKDNPKNLCSLSDITKNGIRVGISMIDCLKGVWEDVCGRARIVEDVRRNITLHVKGCIALIDAVVDDKIDAGFGWNSFKYLEPEKIDVVEIPEEYRIYRSTCAGILKWTKDRSSCIEFIEYLSSDSSRENFFCLCSFNSY